MSEQAAANYRELAEILAEAGVDLIIAEMMKDLVNAPLVIEATLATGLPVWAGPKLAYAETGRLEKPDWIFKEICSPNSYAAEVAGWINNYGIQIVGGCCGTGPKHIRSLKNLITNLPE